MILNILLPDKGYHRFRYMFEATNQPEAFAYNQAIKTICQREGLNPFHQTGTNPFANRTGIPFQLGVQIWELFVDSPESNPVVESPFKTEEDIWIKLETLIPEIHALAESLLH